MVEAPNDVRYKNNINIPGLISIHYFPKEVAVWPKWSLSIFDIEEILLFNDVCLMFLPASKTGVTKTCHKSNQGKMASEFS